MGNLTNNKLSVVEYTPDHLDFVGTVKAAGSVVGLSTGTSLTLSSCSYSQENLGQYKYEVVCLTPT